MVEQRSLREIMQLPKIERERQSRQSQGVVLPKKVLVGLVSFCVILVAGVVLYQMLAVARVPQIVGQSSDIAELQLKQAGFTAKIVERRFSSEKEGIVIAQTPSGHKRSAKNTTIQLIVSGGTEEMTMPDLEGDNELYALRVLAQKGLVSVVVEEPSEKLEGTVLSTLPVAGEKIFSGDTVTLRVSGQRAQVMLQEFNLAHKKIVIVPAYLSEASQDPAYDVARRLSALLKAADAQPKIARFGGSKKNVLTETERKESDVIVWLTLRKSGSNGIVVYAPDSVAFTKQPLQYSVASSVFRQLTQNTVNVRGERGEFGAHSNSKNWVRVSFGSLKNVSDSTLINDAQYKDLIAQSIYMGIGRFFQK